MYIIVVYDVNEKRVNKVCKFLRKYLKWVQNSVFEGEVTVSELKEIKIGLKDIIDGKEDSICFYILRSEKAFKKEFIGTKKEFDGNIL